MGKNLTVKLLMSYQWQAWMLGNR